RDQAANVRHDGARFLLAGAPQDGVGVELDSAPPPELAIELLHRIGRSSIDAGRVEVPFTEIMPEESSMWSETTGEELRVPVGLTGATKRQFLALGRATRQHVLIAGKTGSGKSNLFHVIITNLALWCRPDQVEFYLVDFKKGVEFKCYATHRLPHARVVAIESDREFGLSVLQRVDEEMRRRGELYRRLGVQDLPGYQRAGGEECLPRTLLIIDEFQEFFTEDDKLAQDAGLLLDRLVRQGRAFGIHVLLASQTLSGAYTLARSTVGQMAVRIAMKCSETDSYLILSEDNAAARLLNRPGEAIYNDSNGTIEGNSPFQVVWLDDVTRDGALRRVRERAAAAGLTDSAPLVFEGNAPSDVRENSLLRQALAKPAPGATGVGRAWLGAPNAIKGPTEAVFERQSGNHLLVVGQRDEEILTMLGLSTISLAAQFPIGGAQFVVLSRTPADSAERRFLERVAAVVPQGVELVRGGGVGEALTALVAELDRRSDPTLAETAPPVYVLVHDLARFKELRQEDEFSFSLEDSGGAPTPAAQFQRVVSDGAAHGIHLICTCDSGNTLGRFLNRKAMSEFEMRVVFQMSANDSALLIDTPKANALGLYRAIFLDGQEGVLETFRPYAMPGPDWLDEVAQALRQRG
ncbi:MAG: ATP-binding protein, partial [Verrucomicrobiae bacterium]|nr:ATP-binding protein [Verrucomicrobiae bacterium]